MVKEMPKILGGIMGLFNKNKSKNKYVELYEEYYLDSLNRLNGLTIAVNPEWELLPFLAVICDFACTRARKDNREIMGSIMEHVRKKYIKNQEEMDVFLDRIELYMKTVNGGKLRAEWLFGKVEGINRNAVIDSCIVLGDILANPSCADDYEKAPLLIHGISDVFPFSNLFNSHFYPMMVEFHNKIYRA